MQAAGAEEEEEEEFEYPEELNEFLEYCVAEHGDDWEAISRDFLDVASELDESLADRAHQCFSAEALRRHWAALGGSAGDAPVAPSAAEAPPPPPPAAAGAAAPAARASAPAAAAARPLEEDLDPAQAPSDFSVFRDSLKNRVDQIYLDVQSRLPSTLERGDSSDEDPSPLGGSPPGSGRGEGGCPPSGFAPPPRGLAGAGAQAPSPGAAELLRATPAQQEEALRKQALELFGTDDINQILMGAALQGASVSEDVLNFDTVLLAHGVNPHDIEGPMVQPPSLVAGVNTEPADDVVGRAAAAAPPAPAPPAPARSAARAPAPAAAQAKRAPTHLPARPRRAPAAAVEEERPEAAGEGEGGGDSDGSSDSLEEDFAARRRAMKAASLQPPEGQPRPARAPPRPAARGPAAPAARPTRPALAARPAEPGPSEELGDGEPKSEDDLEAEEGADVDEGVIVMSRLLSRAPAGECAWDVWLDAVRKWPRLQLTLGSPDFIRGDSEELRVRFDAGKLGSLVDEERRDCEERRRKQREDAEDSHRQVEQFVREAERRRELMSSKLGGGFVLQPRDPSLGEQQRRRQEAREAAAQDAEEEDRREAARRQQEETEAVRSRQQAERLEKERRVQPTSQAERLKEPRLAPPPAQAQRPAAARDAEAELAELRSAVGRRRFPLFDRQASCGPPLPGLSERGASALEGAGEACAAYLLPWGAPGGGLPACPSEDQRQAVAALHRRGLAEGLLLLGAGDLEGPLAAAAEAHAAAALVLVRRSAVGTEERLPSGRSLWEVLVGPLPEPAAALAFRRPLALWALDAEPGAGSDAAAAACEETVCIALSPGPEAGGSEAAVAAAMAELQEDGLAVVGLRLAFPDQAAAQAAASVSLRSAVRPGRAVLLLAVRGPHALCVWRSLLGPVDPQLARRTDPASLNARFGGVGRGEAVAFTPPSSSSRALVDVIWGFGGRVDAGSPALPTRPAHAIFLAQPRTYSLELSGQLSFGAAGSVLSGMLFRMGHVVSLTADAAAGTFLATGVREGGSAFAGSCARLLAAPPADASELAATSPVARRRPVDAIGVAAVPREPPHGLGLALNAAPPPATGPEAEEACRLGDPEPLVLGIRPRGAAAAALLLREVCDDLFAKFGPDGGQSPGSQEARPPGLSAGCGVDLLGVRLFDSRSLADAAAGAGPGAQRALDAGLAALRGFRSFAQVVRRAGDAASDCWWAAAEAGGPAVLLCLRGEGLIERFRSFFAREWKLSAVANGDILFSPDLRAARQARHAFFAGQGRGPVAPTFPPSDLRCPQRFEGAPAREAVPQLTAAVLLPPTVDAALFRVLTAVEQHGFALVAAVASGGLSRPTARLLFDQEVEDGHLEAGDLDAFGAAAGCGAEGPDAEGSFRCVWLLLSRPCAVKRLAQLCGHGDPAVNQRHLYASLRSGRERVQNGIRCATSRASAEALLGTLGDELGAHVAPPGHPGDRRLGVEECERTPECSLVAVALADGSEVAVAHVLRELHVAATGRGLALVGLRALGAGLGPASAVWPGLRGSLPQLLGSWRDARPSAAGVAERARDGGPFLLAVCEGPRCVDHARAALAAVVEAARGPAGGLEHYASATPGEGAADVAHLFGELFGAKHYVVAGAV